MPDIGVLVPTNGKTFPIQITGIIDNSIAMTATTAGGGGVEINISIVIPGASIVSSIPNPLPNRKLFFQFDSGNTIKTFFDASANYAEVLGETSSGTKLRFELDFDAIGKVGGAGLNLKNNSGAQNKKSTMTKAGSAKKGTPVGGKNSKSRKK